LNSVAQLSPHIPQHAAFLLLLCRNPLTVLEPFDGDGSSATPAAAAAGLNVLATASWASMTCRAGLPGRCLNHLWLHADGACLISYAAAASGWRILSCCMPRSGVGHYEGIQMIGW
jgi:hypothetical protein